MDTLLCNSDGDIVLSESTIDTVVTTQETLAFLYTGSGTETDTTYTWDAEGVTYADILVVGGGGGGGNGSRFNPAGGGGGGEVVYRRGVSVTPGVEIKVGRGGPISTQGGISQFTSAIQANGGGLGQAGSGGSGGGARRNGGLGGVSVKLSVDGMGNIGGYTNYRGAGGGGGATQAGTIDLSGSLQSGTNGGEGYTANIFGVWNTVYGSGGGGGRRGGINGIGGTNAGDGGVPGTSGVENTGSGGGGGEGRDYGEIGQGGSGGSGIVLVKPNPGALDGLGSSVYTQAVGAYALRRLFGLYTGPQVRLRRSTDNVEVDVTFDKYGNVENFDLDGWLGGATGYVVTWYDQSLGANHVTQTTTTSQPFIVMGADKPHIRFQNKLMTGPNVFGTSTITNMHMIFASRENVRSTNYFVSLNGTDTGNPGRFFIHAPWSNGTWYWDPGSVTPDRASGATSTLGAKTVFSGYKSTTNGYRLNGGTRYLSSGSTTATVTGGVLLGAGATDHSIYDLFIFSSQLSDYDESFIEWNAA